MSNIYLRPGEANPANIRLRDPTAADAGGTVNLTADGLTTGTPTLGSPALGQVHALSATGLATSPPTLGQPTLTVAGDEAPAAPRFQMDYGAYVRRRRELEQPQEQPEAENYDEEIAVLLLAA
ncbi:MAG: hypothetical protein ACK53W_07735 [Gemmatimonadota bacterium]